MARLFVAIETDAALRAALDRLAAAARMRGVRRVPDTQLHLTLRFLGDVDDGAIERIGDTLLGVAARHQRFDVEVVGGGVFGGRRAPSVVWAGLARSPALQALSDDVDAALAVLGLGARDRPFSPHITLARARQRSSGDMARSSVDVAALEHFGPVGTLAVDALVLFASAPSPAGHVHTARARACLRGP